MEYDKAIIAVASGYWGRGRNKPEALARLKKEYGRRPKGVKYFEVPEGTVIDELGQFVFFPPKGMFWDDIAKVDQERYCTPVALK